MTNDGTGRLILIRHFGLIIGHSFAIGISAIAHPPQWLSTHQPPKVQSWSTSSWASVGCGKSTVGEALADRLGLAFHDADAYHPDANRRKMAAGTPLDDLDRRPWLETLAEHIADWNAADGAVLACSALKQAYRNILARRGGVTFIYLAGPRELLAQRLEDRAGHFFPAKLLDSQLADLEPPRDAIEVAIDQPINAQIEQIAQAIGINHA